MLETLRIQNFKSWQDTGDIAFGSLTGFFGTNSSGKSSLLQFLLMLKQTVESSDRSLVLDLGEPSSYTELGTISDILHNRTPQGTLTFDFNWRIQNLRWHKEKPNEPLDFIETISFSAAVEQTDNTTKLLNFGYEIDGRKLGMRAAKNSDKYLFLVKGHPQKQRETGEHLFSKPTKFYGFASDIIIGPEIRDTVGMPVYELEELFGRLFYLGPLRDYPKRTYVWGGGGPTGVGNRGERAVAALLSSRNDGPTIDMGPGQPKRTVEEHVAHWLKELGLIHSFKVQPIAPNRKEYEVRIQRTAESASVFLTDVGFGVSQILPVLVLLFYVPEGSTVILEQPEIHLHPAVQAGLADVFIDAIKRRRLQIVLESHSEHLLQRLQRRMAEEVIDTEAVKLYFTAIKEGRSELTALDLDEYGNIRNWPEGFFGDTLGEAAAMMEAEMKRRMQAQQP